MPSCETEVPLEDKLCPACKHEFAATIANLSL